jgi:SAM-dependent methyltransferase
MGLGCGNPQAIASIKSGETVVDLGSGGGFDCFLSAAQVGETGRVIGVDMTSEMISKARSNAVDGGFENVEFRLGEIENLPVADNSVDVIISNCVINLSPAKQKVFNDSHRILKSGGRLAISDVVAIVPIPEEIKQDNDMYCGCVAGASTIKELQSMLEKSGFTDIKIEPMDKDIISAWNEGLPSSIKLEDIVASASIEATKI